MIKKRMNFVATLIMSLVFALTFLNAAIATDAKTDAKVAAKTDTKTPLESSKSEISTKDINPKIIKLYDPNIYLNKIKKSYKDLLKFWNRPDINIVYTDKPKSESADAKLTLFDKKVSDAENYLSSIDYVSLAVATSYQQSSQAFELNDKKFGNKLGDLVTISQSNYVFEYILTGKNTYGNDKTMRNIKEHTTYYARTGKVVTECFFVDDDLDDDIDDDVDDDVYDEAYDGGADERFLSYIEAVNNDGTLYMQKVEWMKTLGDKGSKTPYYAYRLMLKDGNLYFSGKYINEKSMLSMRINDVYSGFEDFALDGSDTIIFENNQISINIHDKLSYYLLPVG